MNIKFEPLLFILEPAFFKNSVMVFSDDDERILLLELERLRVLERLLEVRLLEKRDDEDEVVGDLFSCFFSRRIQLLSGFSGKIIP